MREAVPAALAVREIGAEAVAERAAAIRAADVTLGLEVAVRAPADSIDGRLVGTGRRPALAAEGVCGLAAAEEVDAAGVLAVAVVRVSPAAVLAAGVAADEALMEGLTVRAAAAGVLGEPVRLASALVVVERTEVDETDERPDRESIPAGLTGERMPVVLLTGEPRRAAAPAAVGGLDDDADEDALAVLTALVLRTAEAGVAPGARLERDAAGLAGVAAGFLRGLRRAAAAADGVAAADGRVARGAGAGLATGSSSTLCISSSGERTCTWLERTKTP